MPVIDLYNQEIVCHAIADRPQISMVMQMLGKALKRLHPKNRPLLHSDQGWQYQMQAYQEALKDQGVIQSMSRKGSCLDNDRIKQKLGGLSPAQYRKQVPMLS